MEDCILSLCFNDCLIIDRKWKHISRLLWETPTSILSLSQELRQSPVFTVLIWTVKRLRSVPSRRRSWS